MTRVWDTKRYQAYSTQTAAPQVPKLKFQKETWQKMHKLKTKTKNPPKNCQLHKPILIQSQNFAPQAEMGLVEVMEYQRRLPKFLPYLGSWQTGM
jgi:hypothetical protein